MLRHVKAVNGAQPPTHPPTPPHTHTHTHSNLSSSLTHLDLEHVPEMQFPRGHVLRYMYEIPSAPVGNMFDFTSEGVQHMVKVCLG